jgi:hypothetical protein
MTGFEGGSLGPDTQGAKDQPYWSWKYDLCENEIHCDGKTIAYSDNSVFELPNEEFYPAIKDLGLKLGWLVVRANLAAEMLEALKDAELALMWAEGLDYEAERVYAAETKNRAIASLKIIRAAIAKAEGRSS